MKPIITLEREEEGCHSQATAKYTQVIKVSSQFHENLFIDFLKWHQQIVLNFRFMSTAIVDSKYNYMYVCRLSKLSRLEFNILVNFSLQAVGNFKTSPQHHNMSPPINHQTLNSFKTFPSTFVR